MANQALYDTRVIILMIAGDDGVGKSVFLRRYVDGIYEDVPGISLNTRVKTIALGDGKTIRLQIRDSPGLKQFDEFRRVHCKGVMGIILMYDITEERSFDSITTRWIPYTNKHAPLDVQTILVGSKTDLEFKREVSRERGELLAQRFHIPFLETSAKNNTNVEETFTSLTRLILNMNPADVSPMQSYKSIVTTFIIMLF